MKRFFFGVPTYDPSEDGNLWVPFDWSKDSFRKKCWWGNYVMNKEALKCCWAARDENKSPLHVASRAIAYDFDWLCIVKKHFFAAAFVGREKSHRRRFISSLTSRGFSRMMRGIESDNQMMELKPRVIRHHNLRCSWRESEKIYQFITMTRV